MFSAVAVLALAIGFSLAAAKPASAAPLPASTPSDIVTAFTAGGEVTLQNDITVNQSLTLGVGTSLTIDLAGYTLEIYGTPGATGVVDGGGNGLPGASGGVGITNAGTLIIENGVFHLLGGTGGAGGAGATGPSGGDGPDAPGPTDAPGGTGGDGGDGGSGGTGGDGGTGLVNSGVLLLSGVASPYIQGGFGGEGGAGGNGGAGGAGGAGVGDVGGDGGAGGDGAAAGGGGTGGYGISNTGIVLASGDLTTSGGQWGEAGAPGSGGAGGAGGPGDTSGAAGGDGTNGLSGGPGAGGGAWQLANDTVTLNGNHTSVTPSSYFVQAPPGTALGDIEAALTTLGTGWPSAAGQSLTGWFTAATGGTQAGVTTLISAQPTLYAQWTSTASAPPTLPSTGSDVGPWAWIAGLCTLVGLGLIAAARSSWARV